MYGQPGHEQNLKLSHHTLKAKFVQIPDTHGKRAIWKPASLLQGFCFFRLFAFSLLPVFGYPPQLRLVWHNERLFNVSRRRDQDQSGIRMGFLRKVLLSGHGCQPGRDCKRKGLHFFNETNALAF